MKAEYKLFGLLGAFFFAVFVIYGFVTDWLEPVGWVALSFSGGLGLMITFYLWHTGRNLPARPEDDLDGDIASQAGDYGAFAPYSWWPLWLALTGSVIFLGMAVGWWVVLLATPFVVWAVVGWVFEFYKGEHAH